MNTVKIIEQSIDLLIKEFSEKQDLIFEGFVADKCLEVASFEGNYFFNISDIFEDMKNDVPKGLITDWSDITDLWSDLREKYQTVNYNTFLMSQGIKKKMYKLRKFTR